jgi:ferric-dicitrate binding protein FerR (iron transport regulator)
VNPELIERFFRKQCNAEEAKKIAAYLKANPRRLEEYLSVYEWNSAIEGNAMPEEFWNEIWQNIQKKNKAKIIALRLRNIAAACIILIAGATYFYFSMSNNNSETIIAVHVNKLPKQEHKKIVNTTNKLMTIVLQDSSVIKLSPASVVQYDVPFPDNKRDIILEGEAIFHVAKNKHKPFTVYSGALATTALGTIFSVKKSGNKNIVTVKLFRGKVVVRSTTDNLKGWSQDVYLLPGQQLKFNQQLAMLTVEKIDSVNKQNTAIRVAKINIKPDSANNQLTFNNTLLPEVMNKLSAYYNVTIKYDTLLIDTMNFTGVVTRNDSLPVILKAIGQMNDLEISKNDNNEFIISKHE